MSEVVVIARKKISNPVAPLQPFNFDNLPNDRNDNIWAEIRTTYGLSLEELSALKNSRCSQDSSLIPTLPVPKKETVRIFGFDTKPDSSAIIIGRRAVVACEHSLKRIKKLSKDGRTVDETYQTEYWLQDKTKRGPRDGYSSDGRIKVKLYKCNSDNDWALLFREKGTFDVNEIAILDTTAAEMSEEDYFMYIQHKEGICFHYPVRHLLNTTNVDELVLSCHLSDIRIQSASKRHVVFSGHEMAPGSSGGGAFVDGKLIAMNQVQLTEVEEDEAVPAEFCDDQGIPLRVVHYSPYRANSEENSLGPKIMVPEAKKQRVESETVASRGDVFNAALNSAIILCRCKRFMAYLQEIDEPNSPVK